MKICPRCKQEKPEADYYRGNSSSGWCWCKTCQISASLAYYHKHKARILADKKEHYQANKHALAPKFKAQRDKLRDEVFRAYGGYICSCCGERQPQFLTIDHTRNDGRIHRRKEKLKTGSATYHWLRRNGYPAGFAVLCWNCNVGKHKNNGTCPHKEKAVAQAA